VPFNVHYFVNTAQREAILPFLFFWVCCWCFGSIVCWTPMLGRLWSLFLMLVYRQQCIVDNSLSNHTTSKINNYSKLNALKDASNNGNIVKNWYENKFIDLAKNLTMLRHTLNRQEFVKNYF
jgi:hypothetical protein